MNQENERTFERSNKKNGNNDDLEDSKNNSVIITSQSEENMNQSTRDDYNLRDSLLDSVADIFSCEAELVNHITRNFTQRNWMMTTSTEPQIFAGSTAGNNAAEEDQEQSNLKMTTTTESQILVDCNAETNTTQEDQEQPNLMMTTTTESQISVDNTSKNNFTREDQEQQKLVVNGSGNDDSSKSNDGAIESIKTKSSGEYTIPIMTISIEDGSSVTSLGATDQSSSYYESLGSVEEGLNTTTSEALSRTGCDEKFLPEPHDIKQTLLDPFHQDHVQGPSYNQSLGPFAPREGKVLSWKNINMTVLRPGSKGKQKEERKILHNVWGNVPKQELTAIMGPSGTGKSSLLEILAGRLSSGGRIRVEDDVRLDDVPINPRRTSFRKKIAFVAQDNSLQVTSTPREAIRFSAKLRLPRSTSEQQLDQLTSEIITELGLDQCADTIVGGGMIKGVSGGERKRTSVGVELVVRPSVVFLDEPTSGLDSFCAVQLCQVLKKVAEAGASVLFTIHQPSSVIFKSFDHLILLNHGRVMYQGSVSSIPSYFQEHGFPVPQNFNPADWIMSVAQSIPLEKLTENGFFSEKSFIGKDKYKFVKIDGKWILFGEIKYKEEEATVATKDSNSSNTNYITIGSDDRNDGYTDVGNYYKPRQVGMRTQTVLLLKREARNICRAKMHLVARFGLCIFLSLLTGCVFWGVGSIDLSVPSHIQSLFGALTMILTQGVMAAAAPALLTFPLDRPVFLREFSTNHYSVVSYFISRLIVEGLVTALQTLLSTVIVYFMIDLRSQFHIVFLVSYLLGMAATAQAVMIGCLVEDLVIGIELLPVVFVPQLLLAGFFITPSLMPVWLRWSRYICPMTYSLNILLEAEFNHDCGSNLADFYCNEILNAVEVRTEALWLEWLLLFILFLFFRLLALMILRNKATKFF